LKVIQLILQEVADSGRQR